MFRPKLFDTLRNYTRPQFSKDLMAGIIVGIVALPLAIAFAIASGVSPEKGLFTAVIAGFIISALGGSRVQIGGPTGAFIVIVYGIVILFMGIVLIGIWVQTFFRGIESVRSTIFIPVARYAYPVIIPTMLMLNAGWLEIANLLERWVHLSPRVKLWVYALFFLSLDLASVYSITYYYYIR